MATRPVIVVVLHLLLSSAAYGQESIATRFGILATKDHRRITFNGDLVLTDIVVGNNNLSLLAAIPSSSDSDVVIVRYDSTAACPALYYIVKINAAGLKGIGPFGTCSEYIRINPGWGTTINIEVPAWRGSSMRFYNYKIKEDVLQEHGISVEGNPEVPDI